MKAPRAKTPAAEIDLSHMTDEALMRMQVCDLPISLEDTWIEDCVKQLYQELDQHGLIFRPSCYLADEWLTPENEPVIGIPFYLAHPSLIRLEKRMMMEAEGETKEWCMKLLRHEAGHAITYAYRLNRKRRWQQIFGLSSTEYGDTYRFRPYSKSYVRHLDGFYAQYHPDEDFVETFAVWLTPDSNWAKKYQGWPAIEKLRYVDRLMKSMARQPPLVSRGRKLWGLRSLKITLANFYKKKKELRAEDFPDFHDGNLAQIFAQSYEQAGRSVPANAVVQKYQKRLVDDVAHWTGEKRYVVDDLCRKISKRCRQLHLMSQEPEGVVLLKLTAYMTTLVMNYRYTGWFRGPQRKGTAA